MALHEFILPYYLLFLSLVFRSFEGKKAAKPKKKKKGKRKKGKKSKKLAPKAGPWLNVLHISNNGIDEQSTETSIDSYETFQCIKRLVFTFNIIFVLDSGFDIKLDFICEGFAFKLRIISFCL